MRHLVLNMIRKKTVGELFVTFYFSGCKCLNSINII